MSATERSTAIEPRPASRCGIGSVLRGRSGKPGLAFRTYRRALIEALRRDRTGLAGALVNLRHGCPGYFRFALDANRFGVSNVTVIRLEFSEGRCTLRLHPDLPATRLVFVCCRLVEMLTMLAT